jgi:hypothetical protein
MALRSERSPVVKMLASLSLPLASALVAGSLAYAAERLPAAQQEASIAFANRGGVEDWRAQGDSVIYFQDQHRHWYRAELFGPAIDLPYVEHIGIDASPSGTLDKFGAIYVRGQRYGFRSFERVSKPPPRQHAHKT